LGAGNFKAPACLIRTPENAAVIFYEIADVKLLLHVRRRPALFENEITPRLFHLTMIRDSVSIATTDIIQRLIDSVSFPMQQACLT